MGRASSYGGDVNVTFCRGRRHLTGTGLSINEVNNAIAQDVVNSSMETGFYPGNVCC